MCLRACARALVSVCVYIYLSVNNFISITTTTTTNKATQQQHYRQDTATFICVVLHLFSDIPFFFFFGFVLFCFFVVVAVVFWVFFVCFFCQLEDRVYREGVGELLGDGGGGRGGKGSRDVTEMENDKHRGVFGCVYRCVCWLLNVPTTHEV